MDLCCAQASAPLLLVILDVFVEVYMSKRTQ